MLTGPVVTVWELTQMLAAAAAAPKGTKHCTHQLKNLGFHPDKSWSPHNKQ